MSEKAVSTSVSTKDLNRTLNRTDLFFVAVSQILGAGILSMTGSGIAAAGRSVVFSFLIAAFFTIMQALPMVVIGGTVRLRGGNYTQIALLLQKMWAGVYIICYIFQNMSIAVYGLSFADYFLPIVPGFDRKVVAIGIITLMFAVQLLGVKTSVTVMRYMNYVLITAFVMFAAFGMMHLQPGYFSEPGFMTHGVMGIMQAGSLLSFATGGATMVLNYSAEAKDPVKDVPIVIITSTLVICVLYAFMCMAAAGVLPLDQVANQSLLKVAKKVLPGALFIFFTIGGCWFNLSKTLLSKTGGMTKPMLQAVVDGWFPIGLAKLNKKKVPVVLFGIFYVIAVVPIIMGLNTTTVANMVLFIGKGFSIVFSMSILWIPKVIPDLWAKSKYHMSKGWLFFLGLSSSAVMLYQTYLSGTQLTPFLIGSNIGIFVLSLIFGLTMAKKNPHGNQLRRELSLSLSCSNLTN